MKYIRLVSDIHLDFDIFAFKQLKSTLSAEQKKAGAMSWLWTPPPMEEDLETTLVIAGDLWYARKFLTKKDKKHQSWMSHISKQFKYVVFVLGNHDYWRANFPTEINAVKEGVQEFKNVSFLENNCAVLDQVKFLGGTLWTDYNNHDFSLMNQASDLTNDYRQIRYGRLFGHIKPHHLYNTHILTKDFIFDNATKDTPDQKIVVVTHMAPSARSLEERYQGNPLAYLYYSELDDAIRKSSIDCWLHGHLHEPVNYKIGNTQVMSNPRGYVGEQSENFEPCFRISVVD